MTTGRINQVSTLSPCLPREAELFTPNEPMGNSSLGMACGTHTMYAWETQRQSVIGERTLVTELSFAAPRSRDLQETLAPEKEHLTCRLLSQN